MVSATRTFVGVDGSQWTLEAFDHAGVELWTPLTLSNLPRHTGDASSQDSSHDA